MFEIHRIEERSPDDRLQCVGVEWTESREGMRKLIFALMILSVVAGTLIAFLFAAFVRPWWACMAIGLAMMSPVFFLERLSLPGRPRQFLFYRDGRMEAPLGFQAYSARYTSVPGHHSDVVSIEALQTASNLEARETPYSSGVAMYLRDGDVAYLAGRLHRDQARKLAVQLTMTLKRLTDDIAIEPTTRARVHQSSGARHASQPAETLID